MLENYIITARVRKLCRGNIIYKFSPQLAAINLSLLAKAIRFSAQIAAIHVIHCITCKFAFYEF